MPNKDEHISQAEHNRQFWSSLNLSSTGFPDWAVTGIFYEGVHWVEAYCAKTCFHSIDHGKRIQHMRQDIILRPISGELEQLKTESENARYRCFKFNKSQIDREVIPVVDNIKNHIQTIL